VRDVLRTALREGASAFVLVHNHPSGDPTPSEDEVRFTAITGEGAGAIGVPLLDHVVVAQDGHVSLASAGLLGERDQPNSPSCVPCPSG
jgi:DNA repair protein RadC